MISGILPMESKAARLACVVNAFSMAAAGTRGSAAGDAHSMSPWRLPTGAGLEDVVNAPAMEAAGSMQSVGINTEGSQ